MSIILKNEENNNKIADFITIISAKCEGSIVFQNKLEKINNEKISIPTINSYKTMLQYNYSLPQLKSILKYYKLKLGGNKSELFNRIYLHLHFTKNVLKIQKIIRGKIARIYFNLRGPALYDRKICTNSEDFVTMEPLEDICGSQFFSYKDTDDFVYGFDFASIHSLLANGKMGNWDHFKNPYNRNKISDICIKKIVRIVKISMMLKLNIRLDHKADEPIISDEKAIELRSLELFQKIDELGNYSNFQWFLSLNKPKLLKMLRELIDIWNYRAQIELQTKRNICPPAGDPFRNLNFYNLNLEQNITNIRKTILEILEKFVNNGVDKDSKTLGACYVLGSLTIVSDDAATSLPWLFQSFSPF
jgi:hypothetical protein